MIPIGQLFILQHLQRDFFCLTHLAVSNIYRVCEIDIRVLFHRLFAFQINMPGFKTVSSPVIFSPLEVPLFFRLHPSKNFTRYIR